MKNFVFNFQNLNIKQKRFYKYLTKKKKNYIY